MYSVLQRTIIVLIIMLSSACIGNNNNIRCEDDPSCILYGITSDILVLDPHISDSIEAGIVFRQLYDTLVYRTESGDFTSGLAQSWQVSDDGLTYTFSLRQDVLFHDGTEFNASAVASNIDRIFDPTINSQKARGLLGSFSRYEIVDNFTVRLHLFEPYTPLLDGLAQPYLGMVSPKAIDEFSSLRFQYHQVGTGPYVLEKYLPGERIEVRRNPNYTWNPSIYNLLDGNIIERVVFRIISDSSARTDLLFSGELDIIDKIPPADARNLSSNSQIQVRPVDIPGQAVVFYFNTTRQHVANPLVRRALLYATNRVAISDTIYLNFSPIAWSPLSESTQYSHTGYVNQFTFDLTQAVELLEEAGYTDSDSDGFLDLNGDKLELDILTPPWGQLPQVADFLRSQWRSIGVDLVINPIPGSNSLFNRIQNGDYDLVTFDVFGLEPSVLNTVFASTASNNVIRYANEDLDRLINQANQEMDTFTRRSQYLQIQSIIMDETLVIPIRDYVNIVGVDGDISNFRFDAYGWYPLLYDARIDSG